MAEKNTRSKKAGGEKKENTKNGKSLVIVESPAKAKTINKYLGSNYVVRASMGHVRDLPTKAFGVDLEKNFTPTYQILPTRKKVVDELKQQAKKVSEIYLATDLDREGEAIAWHLAQALGIKDDKAKRVMFNEITKHAIQQAFEHPLGLNLDKVNAQQARRILDRIVGYQLSPLLWKKIAKNLSAGRVQSVAVRLIVEREQDIEKFVPEEYWNISAVLHAGGQGDSARQAYQNYLELHKDKHDNEKLKIVYEKYSLFKADLVKFDGRAFKATNSQESGEVLGHLKNASYQITSIQKKQRLEKAPAPFTTATLQQQAATRLRFATERTMRVAQQLYEGIELGSQGAVALITYMRTDSTHLAPEAIGSVRDHINKNYGSAYLPERPNFYAAGKRAQEAHEAIRPTDVNIHPDDVREFLSTDQYKLYSLIWKRFVACQMTPARWDVTDATVTASADGHTGEFKAIGRILAFPGFLALLPERTEGADAELPPIEQNQLLDLVDVNGTQHFTQPPPRFTEASLVRMLEAQGIGRPSTYANIISTIQDRGYVKKEENKFFPTDLGRVVTLQLIEHFPQIMDVKFTSHMEEQLDKIEEAHLDWGKVLDEFYDPFKQSLEQAKDNMEKQALESGYTCEQCGKPMVYKWTKTGRFLACSGYPECSNAMSVDEEGKPKTKQAQMTDHKCPKCDKPMILRESRFGTFLGCSGYPECKTTIPCDAEGNPLPKVKPDEVNISCSECGKPMVAKRFRGRTFLGCTGYPECKTTMPVPPDIAIDWPEKKVETTDVKCNKCGSPMVMRFSRRGPFLGCSAFPKCKNIMKVPPELQKSKKDSEESSGDEEK
ncbi:MAG: type I DNA topoisomerase [Phycisphaerae bacterium]|nr:type I DNA topoisomerase [Phycisphaerae bacterium]